MTRCLIYYFTDLSRKEMIHRLSAVTGFAVDSDQFVYTLANPECAIEIRINADAASPSEKILEKEYNVFPYYIEISADEWEDADLNPMVKNLLTYLWDDNIVAIAECDFEGDLPFSGGYKNPNFSWPQYGITIS